MAGEPPPVGVLVMDLRSQLSHRAAQITHRFCTTTFYVRLHMRQWNYLRVSRAKGGYWAGETANCGLTDTIM